MAGAPTRPDLEPLHVLFRVGTAAGLTDGQLLERFVRGPEDVAAAALAALVERHGATVRRVCRRVLGDPHDADDAAQATFLVLARRAGTVRHRESLASWLVGAAVRVSRRARVEAARRRFHERRRGTLTADRRPEQPDPADLETRSAVVEELERLPERLRAPLVACHLEGLTQQEAAARLRCPLRTLQRRLATGRERLRHRLARRGLGSAPAAALGGLADGGLPAAPGWALATVRAALDGAAAGAAPTAARLADATMRSMTLMTALKLTASALALTVTAALGLAPLADLTEAEAPPAPRAIAHHEAEQTPSSLDLTVVDAATGGPLEGLTLGIGFGRANRNEPGTEVTTGADGHASIRLPEGETGNLSIDVHEAGYVPVELRWTIGPGRPLPSSYTLRLDRGTTIGGRVVDEEGRPIEGAEVLVWVPREDRRDRLPVVVDLFNAPVTTDADGRWRCDLVPPDLETLILHVKHPEFIPIESYVGRPPSAPPTVTIERLRDQSVELVLKPGFVVAGSVVEDATGDPIADAALRLGSRHFGSTDPLATTDAEGNFRIAGAEDGPNTLTVQAPGHAPGTTELTIGPDLAPITFRLGPGHTIRGRVVDPEGRPVPGAQATVDEWRGKRILGLRARVDATGRFALEDAPNDAVVVQLWAEGYMNRPGIVITPTDEPRDHALQRSLRVAGAVTDAKTDEPIAAFTVIPTSTADRRPTSFERDDAVAFRHGQYALAFNWPVPGERVFWFEAEGYRPSPSRPVRFDEGTVTLDMVLTPGEAPLRQPVAGVVRLTDGSPAAGATVYLATRSRGLGVLDGEPLYPDRVLSKTAGPDGSFRFPPQPEPGIVVVLDDRGVAERTEDELADSPLTLSPWGRVEGVVRVNGAPSPFAEVDVDVRVAHSARQGDPVSYEYRDTADERGRFSIDRLPPGEAAITRGVPISANGVGFGPWQAIRIEPGETLELTVGGAGRPVVGRLAIPEGLALDPVRSGARLGLKPPPGPEVPENLSPDERRDWLRRWPETEAGRAYRAWQADRRSYPVILDADANFRADDVRPGTYLLDLRLIDLETDEPARVESAPIEVPEADGDAAHEALDVGEVVPTSKKTSAGS